ncbi:MAG: ATP synthase F1 subunit epsilon [Acidimicrobiia bacterium]|nr:ATP synthase F1 subunit epsilon [Acidimicrobiia bacterium]
MPLGVTVVSPEQVLFEGEADMVVCTTTEGELAFLPGHVPFLGALRIAKVRVLFSDESEEVVAVHRGFVEVRHDRVTILSDAAELPRHIDRERAQEAKERIEELLRTGVDPSPELNEALARANLRLELFDYFTRP